MNKLKGLICLFLVIFNTLFWCIFLLGFALIKLLIPLESSKRLFTQLIIIIGECWIYCNGLWIKALHKPKWKVKGFGELDQNNWYLSIANHQSWADIFILQSITNRNIPMLKFFMKDVLIWVPVIGLAWWALDMPFLKRYSEEKIKQNPELRGKDVSAMKNSFSRFARYPVSIFIFAEGTRFTKEKKQQQHSAFHNLLNPKPGGVGLTLSTMPYITKLVDFSIKYESDRRTFWDFLCGKMNKATIQVDLIDIPKEFLGKDYGEDQIYRDDIKKWLYDIWAKKDKFLNN
ncbi:MAG TPA: acetyltransferase [SAR86 cluster bacterium]|jgi:1-acyl-sn-glycerol-3-phosphate acyltransferase|nr:acetyltransferase [SAR86 cluster bacterium]|tara:strand:- start:19509 stop:20372 length:864 start_codon:yes stop_codon:yes gene_type:complete